MISRFMTVTIPGKSCSTSTGFGPSPSRLAAAVASDMERAWEDERDLGLVLVTGGGGQAFFGYIQPLVQGEPVLLGTREDPRMGNVSGHVKYGRCYYGGSVARGEG